MKNLNKIIWSLSSIIILGIMFQLCTSQKPTVIECNPKVDTLKIDSIGVDSTIIKDSI